VSGHGGAEGRMEKRGRADVIGHVHLVAKTLWCISGLCSAVFNERFMHIHLPQRGIACNEPENSYFSTNVFRR